MTNLSKMAGMSGSKQMLDMQAQARFSRQKAYERALEELLKHTVRLAIVRSDLQEEEDAVIGEIMTDERAEEIAQDAAWAMQGKGTCAEGPSEEWKSVMSLALDSWPALFERVERNIAAALAGNCGSHPLAPSYHRPDCPAKAEVQEDSREPDTK